MLYLKHPCVPINKQAKTWSKPKRNPPYYLLAGSSKKAGSALSDIPVKDTLYFHNLFMVHKQYRMVPLYPAYRKHYEYYLWVMTRVQLGNESKEERNLNSSSVLSVLYVLYVLYVLSFLCNFHAKIRYPILQWTYVPERHAYRNYEPEATQSCYGTPGRIVV